MDNYDLSSNGWSVPHDLDGIFFVQLIIFNVGEVAPALPRQTDKRLQIKNDLGGSPGVVAKRGDS